MLVVLAVVGVWSNHFGSTFQDDDFHVIVNNRAIQELGNVPHFFTRPLLGADQPEYAEYRPLALVTFALDYWVASPINAGWFDLDSFIWFLFAVVFAAVLFGVIPGGNRISALLATALFAIHPVTGETLNYASHRGDIIGAIGLLAGLAFRIIWPDLLPRELMHWEGVPKTDWDDFKRRWSPRINAWYRTLIEAPLGLYLIPVVFGLLADPGVAVFPLLLLAYILLFDRKPGKSTLLRVLPSAVICGAFWIAQLVFTWKFAAGFRQPFLAYWITQPWVILSYLWTSFNPVNLTASSDLAPFAYFWSPLALAGFAGLGGLIVLAFRLGKSENWRGVSFGLWWFLIALLPTCLVPQRLVEADSRMFLPLLGLAFAAVRAAWLLYERLVELSTRRLPIRVAAASLAGVLLLVLCWLTYKRTEVWGSERAYWEDVTEVSPLNGRAFVELGAVLNANGQPDRGYAYLQHAVSLISNDAPDQVRLARAFDQLGKDKEAEDHFQRATRAEPNYAPAWSAYGQWLLAHQRIREAYQAASRALQIRPWSVEARHTVMEYYSAMSDWANLQKMAQETSSLDPTDTDSRRALSVAQAGFDQLRMAEEKAKNDPSVDHFLALSVEYYKNHQFQESIDACARALAVRPDLGEAYSNMAASYYALGKNDEAMKMLKECLRIRPDLEVAKKNLEFLESLKTSPTH